MCLIDRRELTISNHFQFLDEENFQDANEEPNPNMSLYNSNNLTLPDYSYSNNSNNSSLANSLSRSGQLSPYKLNNQNYFFAPDEIVVDLIDEEEESSFASFDKSDMNHELLETHRRYSTIVSSSSPGHNATTIEKMREKKEMFISEAKKILENLQEETNSVKASDIILSIDQSLKDSLPLISIITKKIVGFKLDGYASINFQYDRRNNNSSANTISKMLCWQSEPLKTSLNFLPSSLASEAISIFRLILYFMGDKKSNMLHFNIALNILNKLLVSSTELHDEIYCQLCKQTKKNPTKESAELGWQLFLILLSSVPPSRKMFPYLLNYFSVSLQKVVENAKKFVYFSLRVCLKSASSPIRTELPTHQEIQSILLGNLYSLDTDIDIYVATATVIVSFLILLLLL